MKMIDKNPRYYCENCKTVFKTGRYDWRDSKLYDSVCPHCGAVGNDFIGVICDFEDLLDETKALENKNQELNDKLQKAKTKEDELKAQVIELTKQLAAAQQRVVDLEERVNHIDKELPVGSPYKDPYIHHYFEPPFTPSCEDK